MATKKSHEEEEEERQYQQAEKERKAGTKTGGEEPKDTSPSVAGNAPGPAEEPAPPYKPAGPVDPGASDTGQKAPSVEQNKPEGG